MAMTVAERSKQYREKNRELVLARTKDWIRRNPQKFKMAKRRYFLQKKYGLTLQQYDDMWQGQEQKCAICQSDKPGDPKGWHVDHCHKTNQVRGILCAHCNRMLGGALDNPATLLSGIDYLKNSAASSPPVTAAPPPRVLSASSTPSGAPIGDE